MTRSNAILATLTLALCAFGMAVCGALAHASAPYAPSLTDANASPPFLARVPAHARVTIGRQCVRADGSAWYFTETQAYKADGSAMRAQRWNRAEDRTYWTYPGTHTRVIFDGVTFYNFTRHAVLVGGWCG